MDSFQQETIRIALDKLLNGESFFSISRLDKIAEAIGSNPQSHPDYKFLQNLHCVDYSDMPEEMKMELPNKIMAVLSARFDSNLMAKALVAVANGEVSDLSEIEDTKSSISGKLAYFTGR